MTIDPSALSGFVEAVKAATPDPVKDVKPRPAEVVKKDSDGTIWVRELGGTTQTPVVLYSAQHSIGDIVQVQTENGASSIVGNFTDPSASGKKVVEVSEKVVKVEKDVFADRARITELEADDVVVNGRLTANEASITALTTATADIETIRANAAKVANLTAAQLEADHAKIGTLDATYATIANLNAATGRITSLESDNVTVKGRLDAAEADIDSLEADHVSTADLQATNARIGTVEADYLKAADMTAEQARVNNLLAGKATVNDLNAATGRITVLESTKADIADIEANYITADDIEATYMHADMTNSDVAWIQNGVIANGAISSAMINDVSANKLTAGTINGSVINVTNLNADNITTGTINGQRIGEGSLSLDKLSEDVYTEAEVDAKLSSMQAEIDGAIETWTGTEVPTLNNAPASAWTTTADRDKHVGDVYFNTTSGYNYRFTKSGSTYSWLQIKDTDITNALQRIQTAEGKITTFDSDISTLKTDTGELKTKTQSLETSLGDKVDTTTFNELEDTVDGHSQTISQHTTAISQKADTSTVNQVTSRVTKAEQDISGINTTIGELQTTVESKADGSTVTTISNKLNTVSDTVDGHTQTISSVQSTLETKADSSTVSTLTTRVSDVEQDVSGFKQTVAETYATKTEAKQTASDSGKREIPTEDAAELPLLSLTAYGECEQDGTPTPDNPVPVQVVAPSQMLNKPYAVNLPYTHRGVTYSDNGSGGIKAVGTASGGDSFMPLMQYNSANNTLKVGSTYTVSVFGSVAKARVYSASDGVRTDRAVTQTIKSESWQMLIVVPNGTTIDEVVYPMICEGGEAKPFTPYGCISAITTGKNIFDSSNLLQASSWTESGDVYSGTIQSLYSAGVLPIAPTTGAITISFDYMFSDGRADSGSNGPTVTFKYSDGTSSAVQYARERGQWSHWEFTVTSEKLAVGMHFGYVKAGAIDIKNVQVEIGTEATEYEPYRESVSYIDLKGHVLASLPDGTRDMLYANSAGRVWIDKHVEAIDMGTLTGWGYNSNEQYRWFYTLALKPYMVYSNTDRHVVSTSYAPTTRRIVGNDPSLDYVVWNDNSGYLGLRDYRITSTVDLPAALSGVMLWYPLATPQTIELGYITPPMSFDNGTVHVEAEVQPIIDASWWTKAGYDAGKAFNDGNRAADLSELTERVTTAESTITQQAGEIALKANAADVNTKAETTALLEVKANKATLTSEINASADTVKIDATRVNITGEAVFSAINGDTSTTKINGGKIDTESITIGQSQVTGLESDLGGKADNETVQEQLTELADGVSGVSETVESLGTSLDEFSATTGEALDGLSEQMDAVPGQISTAVAEEKEAREASEATLAGDISDAQSDIASHGERLESLESAVKITPDGIDIAKAGSKVTTRYTANALQFLVNGEADPVTYIAVDEDGVGKLFVTNAVVVQELQFGDWAFVQRGNGHLTLKWIGLEG